MTGKAVVEPVHLCMDGEERSKGDVLVSSRSVNDGGLGRGGESRKERGRAGRGEGGRWKGRDGTLLCCSAGAGEGEKAEGKEVLTTFGKSASHQLHTVSGVWIIERKEEGGREKHKKRFPYLCASSSNVAHYYLKQEPYTHLGLYATQAKFCHPLNASANPAL